MSEGYTHIAGTSMLLYFLSLPAHGYSELPHSMGVFLTAGELNYSMAAAF